MTVPQLSVIESLCALADARVAAAGHPLALLDQEVRGQSPDLAVFSTRKEELLRRERGLENKRMLVNVVLITYGARWCKKH